MSEKSQELGAVLESIREIAAQFKTPSIVTPVRHIRVDDAVWQLPVTGLQVEEKFLTLHRAKQRAEAGDRFKIAVNFETMDIKIQENEQ